MADPEGVEAGLWTSAMSFLGILLFTGLVAIAAGVLAHFWDRIDLHRVVWHQVITGGVLSVAGGAIVAWGIATFLK